MAVNPNTDFTAGAVLTAAEQNRFPRGVMAFDTVLANTSVTAEVVRITGSSFTAVANRYYKVTYMEPNQAGGTGYYVMRIKSTSISGTQRTEVFHTTGSGVERHGIAIWVGTLSAGTHNFVGTAASSSGTVIFSGTSNRQAFLLVEDIGPA